MGDEAASGIVCRVFGGSLGAVSCDDTRYDIGSLVPIHP